MENLVKEIETKNNKVTVTQDENGIFEVLVNGHPVQFIQDEEILELYLGWIGTKIFQAEMEDITIGVKNNE